ncbi:hypothetical protein B296_00009796 [Ensete ventricosum]|uniref:EF-hand domain-containing protein n=1 Tax=Ensete ventricosum TaxID=4639 RepID=A0A427AHX3_ENSVE|nr:hypothetical protein B296_00009796 [Ensete ventricosum]
MRVLLSRADACNRWQAAPGSRAVASGPAAFVVWSHLDHSNASILPPSAWKAEAKEGLLLPRKLPSFPSFETHLWKPPAMNLMASSRASCSKEQQKIYQQWFAVADKDRDGRITGNDALKFFAMSKLSRPELKQVPLSSVTSIIDGLKKLYIEKLKPLEVAYQFNEFVSPLLVRFNF